jgi:hypothetical protein
VTAEIIPFPQPEEPPSVTSVWYVAPTVYDLIEQTTADLERALDRRFTADERYQVARIIDAACVNYLGTKEHRNSTHWIDEGFAG